MYHSQHYNKKTKKRHNGGFIKRAVKLLYKNKNDILFLLLIILIIRILNKKSTYNPKKTKSPLRYNTRMRHSSKAALKDVILDTDYDNALDGHHGHHGHHGYSVLEDHYGHYARDNNQSPKAVAIINPNTAHKYSNKIPLNTYLALTHRRCHNRGTFLSDINTTPKNNNAILSYIIKKLQNILS